MKTARVHYLTHRGTICGAIPFYAAPHCAAPDHPERVTCRRCITIARQLTGLVIGAERKEVQS